VTGPGEPAEDPAVLGAITLPGLRRSVAYARAFLRDLLPPGHPLLDDLVTVGSETVCNAVTHTASGDPGGRVTVVLLADRDAYRLEVTDDGAGGARPCLRAEDGGEGGRGMRIVDALARRWGHRADGDRTVVWVEFSAGPCGGKAEDGVPARRRPRAGSGSADGDGPARIP
jgi:anti-sigma regulatory factor (Ser/Thr protein kinase)